MTNHNINNNNKDGEQQQENHLHQQRIQQELRRRHELSSRFPALPQLPPTSILNNTFRMQSSEGTGGSNNVAVVDILAILEEVLAIVESSEDDFLRMG